MKAKYLYEHNKGRLVFQNSWKNKKKEKWIKGREDSNLLSSGTILMHIDKVNQLRVNLRWKSLLEKGKGNQLNVEDVKEIICTYISLIRDIE
jgi:hypothetical protein